MSNLIYDMQDTIPTEQAKLEEDLDSIIIISLKLIKITGRHQLGGITISKK